MRAVPGAYSPEQTRMVALRAVGRREYSSHMLTQYLIRRGHDADEIAMLVADFLARSYVDDHRFALALCRTRLREGKGRLRVRADLVRAGIPEDVAADAMRNVLPPDAERDRAASMIERLRGTRPEASAESLYRRLISRGYAPSDARFAVRSHAETHRS